MKRVLLMLLIVIIMSLTFSEDKTLAAEAPELNSASRLIYIGGSAVKSGSYSKGYYTLKVKNKSSHYSCSWSTDAPDVVAVEKKKGAKAKITALQPGTAVVTANYLDKTTNKRYMLSATITVVKNTSSIEISGYDDTPLKAGTTIKLSALQYDALGNLLQPGKDTKDYIKWESGNTKIAEISEDGVITAVDGGTAVITCYVVQSESGKYSKKSKATAQKKINVHVAQPDIVGISGVQARSLNSIEVTLGSDKLTKLTRNNFSVTASSGSYLTVINTVQKGNNIFLETDRSLADGVTYTVVLKDTKANIGLQNSFKFVLGSPESIGVITQLGDNKVLADKSTPLKFALYNAQGIDITPLDENSKAYKDYSMCVRYEVLTSGIAFINDIGLYVYGEGKDVDIRVSYSSDVLYGSDNSVNLSGVGTVHSVNEGETVVFDPDNDVIYDNQAIEGSKLSFANKKVMIALNDDSQNYIIVRVKGYDGKYIYSNDYDSGITFEPVTKNVCSVSSNGKVDINQNKQTGTDKVKTFFNGIEIGVFSVAVTEATTASNIVFEVNGKTVDSYTATDSLNTGATKVIIKIMDQNGNTIRSSESNSIVNNISIILPESGPWTYASLDSSGNVFMNFDTLGYGSMDGSVYRYKITFSDPGRGTVEKYFSLIVKTPLTSINSTYNLEISGQTEISVASINSVLPTIELNLYEMKESVIYKRLTQIYAAGDSNIRNNSYFYRLYINDGYDEREIQNELALKTDKIVPVYINSDGMIEKIGSGNYTIKVFQKTSYGIMEIDSTFFTLTDKDQESLIEWKLVSNSVSTQSLGSYTGGFDIDVLKAIFMKCFEVKKDGSIVSIDNINFADNEIAVNKYGVMLTYFRIHEPVVVDSRTYYYDTKVEIRQYIDLN